MELRQLKSFVLVAEELHFGRAAEILHLSQPALSKQIQALEDSLDIQLFDRTKHSVKLTAAGHKLLETAHRILQEMERGIQTAQQMARGEAGQLRVGCTDPALFSLMPTIMQHYRLCYPNVALVLTSAVTETQVELLRTYQIDVGFLYLPIRDQLLSTYALYSEPFLIALPATHRLAKQKQISLKSLNNEPILFHPRSLAPALYADFTSCCEQANWIPNIVQEVGAQHTRLGLVAAGVGITFVPAGLQHLSVKGVIYRPIADQFPTLKLALSWRQTEDSPVIRQFLAVVQENWSYDSYSNLLRSRK